jgi:thymidylate kinase
MSTPGDCMAASRHLIDDAVRKSSVEAHYLFYLASVVYASAIIKAKLATHNVYCVRYLIDTVVSHRVAGMDVDLEYDGSCYSIAKPNVTLFVTINESLRQSRITARGKSKLDRVLDDDGVRGKFLKEFERYNEHYAVIDNSSNNIQDAARAAMAFLPWVGGGNV